jgi:hypothetical protein
MVSKVRERGSVVNIGAGRLANEEDPLRVS